MKREKLNAFQERDILASIIISDKCCREIVPVLNPRLFEIEYARIIGSWVCDYFKQYNKAPKEDILKLYRSHSEEITDDALMDNILSVIDRIDKDLKKVERFNDEYAIQEALKYFKARSMKLFAEDIESHLVSGDIDKAERLITNYRKVERDSGESVSILKDSELIVNAYTKEENKLFRFAGAYGRLVGDICREDFVAYLASMKAGKTFMLIDAGVEAMKAGLKVVFFSLEMSRDNMIKRFWLSLSGQVAEDVEINYPYFEQEDDKWVIRHKTIMKHKSSVLNIEKKQQALRRLFRGGDLKIFAEPAYSMTVEKLEMKLDDLEHEGYKADVIIVDYADIMAPSDGRADYRNQIDGIWKRLRALAQKKKAVVFTASQTNRGAINREAEAEDIAEDIRKLAHVTSMVSISRTKVCKKNSIAIFSQLAVREGEPELRKVVATQCLSLGRPVIDSRFKDEVDFDFDEDESSGENKIRRRK